MVGTNPRHIKVPTPQPASRLLPDSHLDSTKKDSPIDRSSLIQRTRRRLAEDQSSGFEDDRSGKSDSLIKHSARQQRPRNSVAKATSARSALSSLRPRDKAPVPGPGSHSITEPLRPSPCLSRIPEGSDDEAEPLNCANSKFTNRKRKSYPLRPSGGHRRYVNSSFFRLYNLQQQLGSLNNSSLVSLFSTLTTSSGSSGNSTVTQKSYDQLLIRRKRPVKRRRSRKEVEGGEREAQALKDLENSRRPKMDFLGENQSGSEELETGKEKGNGISRPSSSSSQISRQDSVQSPPTPSDRRLSTSLSKHGEEEIRKGLWKRQDTFNSDSGISVSSSPVASSRQDSGVEEDDAEDEVDSESEDSDSEESDNEDGNPSRPAPTARSSESTEIGGPSSKRAVPDNDPHVARVQDQEAAMKQHILHSPRPQRSLRPPPQVTAAYEPSPTLPLYDRYATSTVPTTYPYAPPVMGKPHGEPAYFQSYDHSHDGSFMQAPEPPTQLNMQKTTITGYEKVASKLSQICENEDESIKPMYRKFEQLNHRILLHLQDEIAQLEEELRTLDEIIAQTSVSIPEKIPQPSSRRAEARYGSDLHFQRTQTLGKVFLKLQQYNQALTSYTASMTNLSPAPKSDIAAYRTWMQVNAPIEATETRFLNKEEDLVLVAPAAKDRSSAHPQVVNLRQSIIVQCILVLLPPLAFSLVPGIIPKLGLAAVVGCIGGGAWVFG